MNGPLIGVSSGRVVFNVQSCIPSTKTASFCCKPSICFPTVVWLYISKAQRKTGSYSVSPPGFRCYPDPVQYLFISHCAHNPFAEITANRPSRKTSKIGVVGREGAVSLLAQLTAKRLIFVQAEDSLPCSDFLVSAKGLCGSRQNCTKCYQKPP